MPAFRADALQQDISPEKQANGRQQNKTKKLKGRYDKEALIAEIARQTSQHSGRKPRVLKLITLGAPGAGKSFTLNLVLGKHVFEHEMQTAPVTSDAEYAVMPMPDMATIVVSCNVPGIEKASARQARNARCIEEAFQVLNDSPGLEVVTAVILVVEVMGGRSGHEVVEAHKAVVNYLGGSSPAAMALIVNGIDYGKFSSSEARKRYENDMRREGERLIGKGLHLCFIKEVVEPAERDNLDGPEMQQLRSQLLQLVKDLNAKATLVEAQRRQFQIAEERARAKLEEERRRQQQVQRRTAAVRKMSELLQSATQLATYDGSTTQTTFFADMQRCQRLLTGNTVPLAEVDNILNACLRAARLRGGQQVTESLLKCQEELKKLRSFHLVDVGYDDVRQVLVRLYDPRLEHIDRIEVQIPRRGPHPKAAVPLRVRLTVCGAGGRGGRRPQAGHHGRGGSSGDVVQATLILHEPARGQVFVVKLGASNCQESNARSQSTLVEFMGVCILEAKGGSPDGQPQPPAQQSFVRGHAKGGTTFATVEFSEIFPGAAGESHRQDISWTTNKGGAAPWPMASEQLRLINRHYQEIPIDAERRRGTLINCEEVGPNYPQVVPQIGGGGPGATGDPNRNLTGWSSFVGAPGACVIEFFDK